MIKVELNYNRRKQAVEIYVEDEELDSAYIQDKDISNWFESSINGRASWKGLLPEVVNQIGCDVSEVGFEFQGDPQSIEIFNNLLVEYGGKIYSNENVRKQDNREKSNQSNQKQGINEVQQTKLKAKPTPNETKESNIDSIIKRAETLENAGNIEQAKQDYNQAGLLGDDYANFKFCELSEFDDKIFEKYILLAEKGYRPAQIKLFDIYKDEKNKYFNEEKAFEWCKKLAKDDIDMKVELGKRHYYGRGTEKSYEKGAEIFDEIHTLGTAEAVHMLGRCYYFGNGKEKDRLKAIELFRVVAEQGHFESQVMISYNYFNDYESNMNYEDGLSFDQNEALNYLKEVASTGDINSQYMLGECYYYGNEVEENEQKAVEWFRLAAKSDHTKAQYKLGVCYYNGYGVEQDYFEAKKWYELAAESGDIRAQYMLGECYYNGYGVEQDYFEAVAWYKFAAEDGHVSSQYVLGECYYYGNGVEKDYYEAVEWFKLAAESDYTKAQHILGKCYFLGKGVEKDYQQAFELFEKSSEDDCSKTFLIFFYYYGLENARNIEEAIKNASEIISDKACKEYKSDFFTIADKIATKHKLKKVNILKDGIRAGGLLGIGLLIPVANIIALPVAGVAAVGASLLDFGSKVSKMNSDEKEIALMMLCYGLASKGGHEEATKQLKYLESLK